MRISIVPVSLDENLIKYDDIISDNESPKNTNILFFYEESPREKMFHKIFARFNGLS